MRGLSKSEKKIVKKLCDDQQYFSDLFQKDFLRELIIEINNDQIANVQTIRFLIRKDGRAANHNYSKELLEATDKVAQTINLLNYLESQAYIYSFKAAHGTTVLGYIGLKDVIADYHKNSEQFVGTPYPDLSSKEFILGNINIIFSATQALKDYVNNNYKTEDDLRHRQNMFVAWTAIALSVILSLISIVQALR